MNIVVCVKSVPSTTEVRMDPVTNTLIRDGRESVINPCDMDGLQKAVEIRNALGGRVTVLSMGIPDTKRLLRDCLCRGADDGLLLSDRAFAGADTLATSYTLACAVKKLPAVSLIICGKMAIDGDTAQIGPELASVLGIPCLCDVKEIKEIDENRIRVLLGTDAGDQIAECSLPALITVNRGIADSLMPSIAGLRYGEQAEIPVWNIEALGADPARTGLLGSPTQVVRTFVSASKREGISIAGTAAEQAGQLSALIREKRP